MSRDYHDFEDEDILGSGEREQSFQVVEAECFEEGDDESGDETSDTAAGDVGILKPQKQLRKDLSTQKLEELINRLLTNGVALEQFLEQLKLNRYSAGSIKQLVFEIARSKHPRSVYAISRILDATPKMNLRLEMRQSIKKLDEGLYRKLYHIPKPEPTSPKHRPIKPYRDPGEIPRNEGT